MCGIAGLLGSDVGVSPEERAALTVRMGATLRHRGPDDEGSWSQAGEPVLLIHRRLSILDLSAAGAQPMVSHCGRYVLAYNGEVYNFRDLKGLVERARGRVAWRGHSDSEYLLEAIAVTGVDDALRRCNGMFAVALWDRRERVLTLARDRLGKKPLYYGLLANELVFGSEVRALETHPAWTFGVDKAAVATYLRMGYVPEPATGFSGIRKLPAASRIEVRPSDVRARRFPDPIRYWRPTQLVSGRSAPSAGSVDLESTLTAAVASRMVADVPVGAFLSGGVDSSIVVALMARLTGPGIRTYTIGFTDGAASEALQAAAVAQHLGTVHEEVILTPNDAARLVPEIVAVYDEPFADSSAIPSWLVARLAGASVKVVLSGDGADELFGGYSRYESTRRLWAMRGSLGGRAIGALARRFENALDAPEVGRLGAILWAFAARDPAFFYRRRTSFFPNPGRLLAGATELPVPQLAQMPRFESMERMMMYADLVSYLPDDILAKVDRASMAHGVEVRSPFLDDTVIDYAWRLPDSAVTGRHSGKHALKELLYRLVPRRLVDRPKSGFGMPIDQWLRGDLRAWTESQLFGTSALEAVGCERGAVRAIWNRFLGGESRLAGGAWALLMLSLWYERHTQTTQGQ